ncbi:hypothetical protein BDM02DRAFT_3185353 [Thelephora ganbajun]|uniref:Uncharacterized protein n=1 Tax=Thelephora ganbajun TaxID=370292 RepID=A0ACB6ZLH1_THEGA|nr:hypothetical protein BDM02DRAFT_3185353 [Thelephora ganbajun]
MAAPITSEVSRFSRTTFLEPAICRPMQGIAPPHLNLRPIWRNEDPQGYIKVPSLDQTLFEGDSFGGRSYSSSFLRSSARHHSNHQCLSTPLTESPPPHPYPGFGSMPSYLEPPQFYPISTNPHTSSGSPTFPLRPSDNWSLTRTPSLSSSQDSFWTTSHGVLAGLPELSHRRSYSTISSDAVSTPARETDSQISPVSSESPWDRQCIEVPSSHRGQHDPSPTPQTPIAPWINENGDDASRARQPIYTARMRTSQACQKCRSRKAKCDGKSPCERCATRGLICEYARERRMRGPNKRPGKSRRREEDSFSALG